MNTLVKQQRHRGSDLATFPESMQDFFGRFFGEWEHPSVGLLAPLDIAEDESGFTLKIDLPGVAADDIDIQVHDNRLTLTGHRRDSSEETGVNYYHVERRSGSFRREVVLPTAVDEEHIEAHHTDGVLTVRLPKSERAKPRKIEIEP